MKTRVDERRDDAVAETEDAPGGRSRRLEEFQHEIAGMKVRGGGTAAVETRLLVLGALLGVAGIVLVIVGWFGASGTAVLSDQIPYVISGGILGIGLTIIGAVLYLRYSITRYFRYWLIRLVYEQREQTDRTVEALGRIEERLAGRDPAGRG